jgi:cytochrome c oxidase subunit 3
MAVRYAQLGETKKTGNMLLITIACACIFMVVKYFEYMHKIHVGFLPGRFWNPQGHGIHELSTAIARASENGLHIPGDPYHLRSFFGIYFIMTGVHGLHVLIGIGVLIWMWVRNNRGEFGPRYFTPIDIVALYWHLVDLIWIYLFPLMYLID